MCKNWSPVKLYLHVLKYDEHETHIKYIYKTTLKILLRVVYFVFLKSLFINMVGLC